jgi:hypothetical protein
MSFAKAFFNTLVRGWPFFSVFSLQKKPRHAWLTPPGSDADQETATFPSCVLLPSMGYDMRQGFSQMLRRVHVDCKSTLW